MPSRPRSPSLLSFAALTLAPFACSCTTTPVTTLTNASDGSSLTTAMVVQPAQFLGNTPCSGVQGAMRSYVATLVDRTFAEPCGDGLCNGVDTLESCAQDCAAVPSCGDGTCGPQKDKDGNDALDANGDAIQETADSCPVDCKGFVSPPFTFPSSLPTPCSVGVHFNDIVGGHFYSLEIDGYEQFAPGYGDPEKNDEIGPAGWKGDPKTNYTAYHSGNRHMEDAKKHAVAPRWFAACGRDPHKPTTAAASGTTLILGCDTLEDLKEKPETAVLLDPKDALAALPCAADAAPGASGALSFDIESEEGLPPQTGILCSADSTEIKFTGAGVVPGQSLHFFVSAHAEDGGPVVWGATCTAIVQEGLTVRAACAPLSDRGSLAIDFPAVLGKFGFACGSDFASYDAELASGDVSLKQTGLPCAETVVFSPLVPGSYDTALTVRAGEVTLFSAQCTGQVQPGRSLLASDCKLQ